MGVFLRAKHLLQELESRRFPFVLCFRMALQQVLKQPAKASDLQPDDVLAPEQSNPQSWNCAESL